jgi:hypothetical protein
MEVGGGTTKLSHSSGCKHIQRMLTDLLKLPMIAYGYTTHVQIKMNENDILIWIMNSCVGGSSNTCSVVRKCFFFLLFQLCNPTTTYKTTTIQIANIFSTL